MNLLRRMRASSTYGANSNTLKPNFVREKEKAEFKRILSHPLF